MGILAGFLGLGLVAFLNFPLVRIFPWMLVAFLTLFVLGLDKLIPKAPFAKRFFARVSERLINLPKPAAAILLGVATPLLPCGPLYMILWVALISANPLFGAQIALGFGLGTVPLMFITGSQYSKYKDRFTPKTIYAIQRLLALIAVIFISFRLLSASGPLNGTFCCPW